MAASSPQVGAGDTAMLAAQGWPTADAGLSAVTGRLRGHTELRMYVPRYQVPHKTARFQGSVEHRVPNLSLQYSLFIEKSCSRANLHYPPYLKILLLV